MSSLQVAHRARAGFGRPTPALLGAVVLAEAALVAAVAAFGFTNDHVPRIQVVLYEWMTVPYVVAGIVAWLRRPASRLGPLLIASGLGIGLSGLQYSHAEPWQTIGEALDLLPAALFLHVYLAFPDGRLRSRSERLLVGAAYPTAVGVQVVMLVLG